MCVFFVAFFCRNVEALVKGLKFLKVELTATKEEVRKREDDTEDSSLKQRLRFLTKSEEVVENVVSELEKKLKVTFDAVYETARFFGDESAHQTSKENEKESKCLEKYVRFFCFSSLSDAMGKNFCLEAFFQTLREFLKKFNECCNDVRKGPKKYAILLAGSSADEISPIPEPICAKRQAPGKRGPTELKPAT